MISTPISWGKVHSITQLQLLELQVPFYLLCRLRSAVLPSQSRRSGPCSLPAQLSSGFYAVLHLSDWARLWRAGRASRMGGRRQRSGFHMERESWVEGVLGVFPLWSTVYYIFYIYSFSSFKKTQLNLFFWGGKKYLSGKLTNLTAYTVAVLSCVELKVKPNAFKNCFKTCKWKWNNVKMTLTPHPPHSFLFPMTVKWIKWAFKDDQRS